MSETVKFAWASSRQNGAVLALTTLGIAAAFAFDWGTEARAALVAVLCLFLWLSGWVPVWVPTLVLWATTSLLLGTTDARFTPQEVIRWSVDPVLALFLGGFALAAAAERHGVDIAVANFALNRVGSSVPRLVLMAALSTAFLSMWMSNVAGAALMINAFRPIWGHEPEDSSLRRALLLAIALAANVGGIATPIGTGANGIAMASVAQVRHISFLNWMSFGVPLAFGLTIIAVVLVLVRFRTAKFSANTVADLVGVKNADSHPPYGRLTVIFALTVLLWLSEPLHGVPPWIVALGAVAALLLLRVISWRELLHLDWGTLVLVAGGIALGMLLETSGIVQHVAAFMKLESIPVTVQLLGICLLAATAAALMSNTGTAAFLIPLAATLDPAPSTAIIVAVACSMGMPFGVSTPANAMAVAGGVRAMDLLVPGLILMIGGCVLVAYTGPFALGLVGIP